MFFFSASKLANINSKNAISWWASTKPSQPTIHRHSLKTQGRVARKVVHKWRATQDISKKNLNNPISEFHLPSLISKTFIYSSSFWCYICYFVFGGNHFFLFYFRMQKPGLDEREYLMRITKFWILNFFQFYFWTLAKKASRKTGGKIINY